MTDERANALLRRMLKNRRGAASATWSPAPLTAQEPPEPDQQQQEEEPQEPPQLDGNQALRRIIGR